MTIGPPAVAASPVQWRPRSRVSGCDEFDVPERLVLSLWQLADKTRLTYSYMGM